MRRAGQERRKNQAHDFAAERVTDEQNQAYAAAVGILRQVIMDGTAEEVRHSSFNAHLAKLRFPAEALRIEIKFEAQKNGDVKFAYRVNGRTDEALLSGWAQTPEKIRYVSQLFPGQLLNEACQLLREPHSEIDLGLLFDAINMKQPLRKGSYDLTQLRSFYPFLLRAWQRGKRAYTQTQTPRKLSSWKQTVKWEVEAELATAPIAGLELDADTFDELLERLNSKHFTAGIRAKLKDRRESAPPGELALDHAAHLCGVPLYTHTIRQLHAHLRDQTAKL